jgi:hypothetical protein
VVGLDPPLSLVASRDSLPSSPMGRSGASSADVPDSSAAGPGSSAASGAASSQATGSSVPASSDVLASSGSSAPSVHVATATPAPARQRTRSQHGIVQPKIVIDGRVNMIAFGLAIFAVRGSLLL